MSTETQELALASEQRLAPVEPSINSILQAAIERGITAESVAAIKELVLLKERMDYKEAERKFASAFVELQGEIPVIVAKTVIPNRGKYERFEDIMCAISEPLASHGFSVSFDMEQKDGKIIETCHLSHVAGVTRSNSFAVRVGKADTETQADCKAATTAKRLALCNALNLVIRQDVAQNEDAGEEGAFIDSAHVMYLKEQLAEAGGTAEGLLELAGSATFEGITSGKYPVLVNALNIRKRAKAKRI